MAGMEARGLKEQAGLGLFAGIPRAVWVLSAAMLVIRSAEVFYLPIMPLYARLLDAAVPLFIVGMVTGIDRLGAVVINPLAGRWADIVGRRWPYILGVVLTSLGSFLGGLAFGVGDLTVYRLLSGVGYGTLTIAALSSISDLTSLKNRATAMSLFSASTLAGAALGPFPGGYIAESLGYRTTFYAGGLVELLVGLYAFFWVREQARVPSPNPSARMAPTSVRQVLGEGGVLALCLSLFLWGIGHGAFMYFTVPLYGASLGYSPSRVGWVISAFGLGHILGALAFGPLSDRLGRRKPFAFIAVFGTGIPVALFAFAPNLAAMIFLTLFVGFISAPCCGVIPAMVAEMVPQAAGTAMGTQRSTEQLGIFIGPVIGGALVASLGYQVAILTYAAIMVLASLVVLAGVRETK